MLVLGAAKRGRRLGEGRHSCRRRAARAVDRPAGAGGRGGAEAPVLRHQAASPTSVIADQQQVADTFFALGLLPKANQDFRRRTEVRDHEHQQLQRQHPLVPADPRRRPLSRHRNRRPRGELQLSAPDRAGRRSTRLFRRAAADRAKLRGFLGGRLGGRAVDRAAALSCGGPARAAVACGCRAHDRDARPGVEWAAADQRRHRRRSRREQGRRHFPLP